MIDINDKYKALFLNKDKRYNIVTGGRGSGKSFAVTLFLVLLTEQSNEVILFTRYTLISAHISIIPEFLNMIEMLGWHDRFIITKDQVVNKVTGSKILFKGLKTSSGTQTANLKSLSGVTCWVLDEAEELVDEKVFDKIDLSIRSKNAQNRVIMILNPTTSEHFIYKKWFETGQNNNTCYIHTSYLDNKNNLDDSILQEIERMRINNPKKYDHVILGGWLDKAEGVVLTNWRKGDFDVSIPTMYGMDFGFSNDPTTLVKVAVNWKHRKLYVKQLHYARDKGTKDVVNICRLSNSNALIIADCAEPRLISDVRREGVNITSCIKGPDSIRAGIKLLQDFEIIVDHDSHDIIKELNNYVWSDKKSNVPIDNFNHIIDAIRYVVFYQKHKTKTVRFNRR
jgi:phage terminase large subunit